jgi:hypothetical protein
MNAEEAPTSSPLEALVSTSELVFQVCRQAATDPGWTDFPSLTLYRHGIQMADGIQILLQAGASGPAVALLRSMLESVLALKYIHLGTPEEYNERSMCWLCANINQAIAIKEKADRNKKAGAELQEALNREHGDQVRNLTTNDSAVADPISDLRDRLQRPDLVPMQKAYSKLGRHPYHPPWYRLCHSGPKNNCELAKIVGMQSAYLLYYGWWSNTVHGTDMDRLMCEQGDGSEDFAPLRSTEDAEHIADGAEILLQVARKLMAEKFLQEQDLEKLLSNLDLKPFVGR